MNDYFKYYGKHKNMRDRKDVVAQNLVAQKYPTIRSRVNPKLYLIILDVAKERKKSISEMTRLLWEDYIKKKTEIEQKEDVKHFLENA